MIKACIFDLDGTVINTVESLRYSISETMKQFGYPEIDEEHTKAFIGNGGRKFVSRALKLNGSDSEEDLDKAFVIYKKIFSENCTRGNAEYPGTKDTLSKLKSMGIKLAVLSNKSQERVEDCIYEVYGKELFDVVYGERPGVPLKPDPAAIKLVSEELGIKPGECLYVGDGDTDMEAGLAAGCITVGVTWGYRPREVLEKYGPHHVIDSIIDLLTLIKYYV